MRGPSSVNSSVCVDKLSRKEIVQFFPTSPNGTAHSTVKRLTCIFIYQISNKKKNDEIEAIQRTFPAFGGCLSLFMNKDHQE